jgi:hypothetical protein
VSAARAAHFARDDKLIVLDVKHFDLLHQALRCASWLRLSQCVYYTRLILACQHFFAK